MKPFLGIDITENKKNEQPNGAEFVIASASSAQAEALGKASENAVKMIKGPLALKIAGWICGAAAIVIAGGVLDALTEEDSVTLVQAYQNAPWLFWVTGVLLAACVVLIVVSNKQADKVLESDEGTCVLNRLENISKNIQAELGIPVDAVQVDVLSFRYKLKKGEPVPREKGMETTPYTNSEMWLFQQDGQLCLADLEKKYAIALCQLRGIRTVNKSISVPMWNKETEHNKGEFKPYKIKVNSNSDYCFKPYHILEFEKDNERWGIYFPCYELPTFEKVTGLSAETSV